MLRQAALFAALLSSGAALGAVPVHGWRRDGTGIFLDATPPTRWSTKENVVWATRLPSWGNASPIVVKDRIFVTAEPTTLLCLRLSDGRVLWKREVSVLDTLAPEEAAELSRTLKDADRVEAVVRERQDEYEKLKRDARKRGAGPEVKERLAALSKELNELRAGLEKVAPYRPPEPLEVVGNASSTPVSDGENVYVIFGNRVVASFDLQGKKRWAKWIPGREKNMNGFMKGQSASPLVVAGRLIVPLGPLAALALDDGRTLWSGKTYHDFGTPFAARIGEVDVLLAPDGRVLRALDGKVLTDAMAPVYFVGPQVHGTLALVIGNDSDPTIRYDARAAVYRLPEQAVEGSRLGVVWKRELDKASYFASPLFYDGKIFTLDKLGGFGVLDAASGQDLHRRKLEMGSSGSEGELCYPSLSLAGRYIHASNENGTTVVLDREPPYGLVATNKLEPFRSTPIFVGRRMYVRGMEHLYCVEERKRPPA